MGVNAIARVVFTATSILTTDVSDFADDTDTDDG